MPISTTHIRPTHIRPTSDRPLLDIAELWSYRALLYILIWRTIKVRYQQTIIGIGWAVLQPLLLTIVMTFIFGLLVKVPTNGVPYPIFVLTGLVVWQFVANTLQQASISVVANAHLITRIYFPRVLLPVAAIAAAVFDLLCTMVLMFIMLAWYDIGPSIGVLMFIPMLLLASIQTLGFSLWFGALNVRYRDVGYLLPFLIQLWMFVSPVIYPTNLLPPKYEFLYALNPVAVIIDTSRWAFIGAPPPSLSAYLAATAVSFALLLSGLWFFRRHEGAFADVV
jgi:lipopolysaccharide transport system permease protein